MSSANGSHSLQNGAVSQHTQTLKRSDDDDGYYSFPRNLPVSSSSLHSSSPSALFPSAAAQQRTTSAAAAAAAAASLSCLLSDPQKLQEKWHEHQQRILEAILPPKGFDSVAIQLPRKSKYLNPELSTTPTPARNTIRRLPVVTVSASVGSASPTSTDSSSTTPTEKSPSPVSGSSESDSNSKESRSIPRVSSRRRREAGGSALKTDQQVAQAAVTAAIAVGNAAGTTGAIASAAAAAAAFCQEEQELSRREARSPFTLLCVDDDVISCKIMAKICEKWGQPYETVTSGDKALELYKRSPEKFRCILMDLVMPDKDGLETTKLIRKFEEESWAEQPTENAAQASQVAATAMDKTSERKSSAIRRAVIIGMAPRTAPPPPMDVIKETGLDLVVEKPLHLRLLSELLFSGPETNAVALYGGVDPESLRQAGYPLRMRPIGAPRRPPLDSVFGSSF